MSVPLAGSVVPRGSTLGSGDLLSLFVSPPEMVTLHDSTREALNPNNDLSLSSLGKSLASIGFEGDCRDRGVRITEGLMLLCGEHAS